VATRSVNQKLGRYIVQVSEEEDFYRRVFTGSIPWVLL
jgi:hypothetical protein